MTEYLHTALRHMVIYVAEVQRDKTLRRLEGNFTSKDLREADERAMQYLASVIEDAKRELAKDYDHADSLVTK